MKLSTAIDLGRTLGEPMDDMDYRFCAIGVGLASLGVAVDDRSSDEARRRWPWLNEKATSSPHSSCTTRNDDWLARVSKGFMCVDDGELTMDELIAWVKSVEPAEPPEPTFAEGLDRLAKVNDRLLALAERNSDGDN